MNRRARLRYWPRETAAFYNSRVFLYIAVRRAQGCLEGRVHRAESLSGVLPGFCRCVAFVRPVRPAPVAGATLGPDFSVTRELHTSRVQLRTRNQTTDRTTERHNAQVASSVWSAIARLSRAHRPAPPPPSRSTVYVVCRTSGAPRATQNGNRRGRPINVRSRSPGVRGHPLLAHRLIVVDQQLAPVLPVLRV